MYKKKQDTAELLPILTNYQPFRSSNDVKILFCQGCVCVCVCVCELLSRVRLCNPTDCSPPGPSVHGILQARTLEWVAMSFSKRNYRKKKREVAQSCLTLRSHGLQPTSLFQPWNLPGRRSTGVGCHFLLHCQLCFYIY